MNSEPLNPSPLFAAMVKAIVEMENIPHDEAFCAVHLGFVRGE
jgi:hypothetical protein